MVDLSSIVLSSSFVLIISYQRVIESTYSYRNAAMQARVHGPLSKPILRCVSIRFPNIVRPSFHGIVSPIRLDMPRLKSAHLTLPSSLCGSLGRCSRSRWMSDITRIQFPEQCWTELVPHRSAVPMLTENIGGVLL